MVEENKTICDDCQTGILGNCVSPDGCKKNNYRDYLSDEEFNILSGEIKCKTCPGYCKYPQTAVMHPNPIECIRYRRYHQPKEQPVQSITLKPLTFDEAGVELGKIVNTIKAVQAEKMPLHEKLSKAMKNSIA